MLHMMNIKFMSIMLTLVRLMWNAALHNWTCCRAGRNENICFRDKFLRIGTSCIIVRGQPTRRAAIVQVNRHARLHQIHAW